MVPLVAAQADALAEAEARCNVRSEALVVVVCRRCGSEIGRAADIGWPADGQVWQAWGALYEGTRRHDHLADAVAVARWHAERGGRRWRVPGHSTYHVALELTTCPEQLPAWCERHGDGVVHRADVLAALEDARRTGTAGRIRLR